MAEAGTAPPVPTESQPHFATAKVQELLRHTTLSSLLQERGAHQRTVVTVHEDEHVGDCMEKLATYGISGAPLLSSSGAFRGFVDVPTLLSSFFKGQYIDRETFGTEPHEAFAVGKEELAPLPTRLREDLPLPAHPPRLLSLLEQLNSIGPKFTKAPLKTVAPSNDGAQLFAASLTGNVHSLITSGFLAGGGSSDWSVVHRAAVWDPDTKACVAVVSQTDILRWLHARLQDGRAGDALGKATLEGLGLTPKPVFCVPAESSAVEAFAALLHRGLPCAGVTGGGDPEAVVGALTLNDLRGLGHDKFGILALPVGEYLALKHGAVWSSAGGGSAHHASPPPSPRASSGSGAGGGAAPPSPGAPTRRDTLLQKHTLVALQPSATFRELVECFVVRKARAVFVVDASFHPLAVCTPTDVLRLITA